MKCRVDWFKNSDNPYISCFLLPFLKMNRRKTILRTSRAENFEIKSKLTTVPTTTVTTTAVTITTAKTTKTTIKIGIGRRFQWDRLLVKSQPF